MQNPIYQITGIPTKKASNVVWMVVFGFLFLGVLYLFYKKMFGAISTNTKGIKPFNSDDSSINDSSPTGGSLGDTTKFVAALRKELTENYYWSDRDKLIQLSNASINDLNDINYTYNEMYGECALPKNLLALERDSDKERATELIRRMKADGMYNESIC